MGEALFDAIRHWKEVRQLQSVKRQLRAEYQEKIKALNAQGLKGEELQFARQDAMIELDIHDEEMREYWTNRLMRIADDLQIPIPSRDLEGAWVEGRLSFRWGFSDRTISELRAAIRREKMERSEYWQRWVVMLMGLIGTLIGLIALLKS